MKPEDAVQAVLAELSGLKVTQADAVRFLTLLRAKECVVAPAALIEQAAIRLSANPRINSAPKPANPGASHGRDRPADDDHQRQSDANRGMGGG
jgi:hypothetical protein